MWWRWYYWLSPVAWTLNGMVTSQFGDLDNMLESGQTVKEFIRSYFGYRHDLLWVVAVVVIGFDVFFALMFGVGIKVLNFQRR